MNPSRSTRFAKCAGLLFVVSCPVLLGANEDMGDDGSSLNESSLLLVPLANTQVSNWLVGCHFVDFEPEQTAISKTPSDCISPKMASNADPVCKGKPTFYIADGKLYDEKDTKNPIDLKPLLGNKIPNAPSVPVVAVPRSGLVFVFFGYAPAADTTEFPRAFFVAIDRTDLTLKGSFPLDIGAKDNVGCGTIHLAGAPEDAYPNSATVFISTCQHAYGIRVEASAKAGFPRTPFFHEELTNAKAKTHHRAEMEVAPTKNGYAILWPFEHTNGSTFISMTLIEGNGSVVMHEEKNLYFPWDSEKPRPFIKGLEIAPDWSKLYVTWPGNPKELFKFPLVDEQGKWSMNSLPETFSGPFIGGEGIGFSQIEMGPDGKLYVLRDDRIDSIAPSGWVSEAYNDSPDSGFTSDPSDGTEPIRLLPSKSWWGNVCDVPASDAGADSASGSGGGGAVSSSASSGMGGTGGAGSSTGVNSGAVSSSASSGMGGGGGAGGGAPCGMGGGGGMGSTTASSSTGASSGTWDDCPKCTDWTQSGSAYQGPCVTLYNACIADNQCLTFLNKAWLYNADYGGACTLRTEEEALMQCGVLPDYIKLYNALDQCVYCHACRWFCDTADDYCDVLENPNSPCP